jgi:hypothetical protein
LATRVRNKKIFQIPYPVKDLAFISVHQSLRLTDLHARRISPALVTFDHVALHGIIEDSPIGACQRAEETVDAVVFIPFNDPCLLVLVERFGWTGRDTTRVPALQTDRRSKK